MWALILTFAFSTNSTAIASVPGFKSEAACNAAASAWLSQTHDLYYRRALCVKQD